jgi:hypothetical protein
MDNAFQHIKHLLARMEQMQHVHITAFDTQVMPDLEKQQRVRKNLFDQLAAAVDRFMKDPEPDMEMAPDDMIRNLNEQMHRLLHQNHILSQKVTAHKNQIQHSLKNLSKGKHAIQSYGSPSSMTNRPRAINLTN